MTLSHLCHAFPVSSPPPIKPSIHEAPHDLYVYTNRPLSSDGKTFLSPSTNASFADHSPETTYLVKVTVEYSEKKLSADNIKAIELIAKHTGDEWVTLNSSMYDAYKKALTRQSDLLFYIPSSTHGFDNHIQSGSLLLSGLGFAFRVPFDSLFMITFSWPSVESTSALNLPASYHSAIKSASHPSPLDIILAHMDSINHKVNKHVFAFSRGASLINTMARTEMSPGQKKFKSLFLMSPDTPHNIYTRIGGTYHYFDKNGRFRVAHSTAYDLRRISENTRIYYYEDDAVLYLAPSYEQTYHFESAISRLGRVGLADIKGKVSDSVSSLEAKIFITHDRKHTYISNMLQSFDLGDSSESHIFTIWSMETHADMARTMLINSPTLIHSMAHKIDNKDNLYNAKTLLAMDLHNLRDRKILYLNASTPEKYNNYIYTYANHSVKSARIATPVNRKQRQLHMGYALVTQHDSVDRVGINSQFDVRAMTHHYKYKKSHLQSHIQTIMQNSNGDLVLYIGDEDFKVNMRLASIVLDKMNTQTTTQHAMLVYSPISTYAAGPDSYHFASHMARSSSKQMAGLLTDLNEIMTAYPGRQLTIVAPGYAGLFLYCGLKALKSGTDIKPFIRHVLLASSSLSGAYLEERPVTTDKSHLISLTDLLDDLIIPTGNILVTYGKEWNDLDEYLTSTFDCKAPSTIFGKVVLDWHCNRFYDQPKSTSEHSEYPVGLYFNADHYSSTKVKGIPYSGNSSHHKGDIFHHYQSFYTDEVFNQLTVQ